MKVKAACKTPHKPPQRDTILAEVLKFTSM